MSAICSFYKDKTIFLTGGTGFIGKLLIEQLLRKTEPKRIYLLIRQKKGLTSDARIENLFQDVVFDRLKAERSDFIGKIEIIPGDLSEDNLGISEEYIERLCETVEVVIHGGASVALNDDFKPVIDANLKGSLSMMKLCRKIKKLQIFAVISTAYSFCPYTEIKEELYPIHITSDKLINLVDNLTEIELKEKSKEILGEWPNPYALCKALVEDVTINQAEGLPVVIIRPCIIMGTYSEPVPGWIDNYYGTNGIMAGVKSGTIKVVRIDPKEKADIVPGDMVASCVLAATYKNSLPRSSTVKPIYNCVPYEETKPKWQEIVDFTADTHPYFTSLNQSFRPFHLLLMPNYYLFEFYSLLFHLIPALFIDFMHKLLNKKPKMYFRYKKLRSFLQSVSYFGNRSWKFSNDNTVKLWNELSEEDKRLFQFDTKCIDWPIYFSNCFQGIIIYLFHEKPNFFSNYTFVRRRTIQLVKKSIFYGFIAYFVWNNFVLRILN
ncbi:hypothetical protein O3M35_008105 [Rhynocoris fuscipes]|uniref:Fatty acyl-CoA reductase n=1 Tax=Rhynocoris fuscipes TaxID=488301 RepID=A0AAW1DAZ1_9HEMI